MWLPLDIFFQTWDDFGFWKFPGGCLPPNEQSLYTMVKWIRGKPEGSLGELIFNQKALIMEPLPPYSPPGQARWKTIVMSNGMRNKSFSLYAWEKIKGVLKLFFKRYFKLFKMSAFIKIKV